MYLDKPTALVHEYIQRMMAWMLFMDPAGIPRRQAMQLGLGAGSLTKFCSRAVGMQTTAIEHNPQVLQACRGWFKLPTDNARMRVVLADYDGRPAYQVTPWLADGDPGEGGEGGEVVPRTLQSRLGEFPGEPSWPVATGPWPRPPSWLATSKVRNRIPKRR